MLVGEMTTTGGYVENAVNLFEAVSMSAGNFNWNFTNSKYY